MMNIDQINNIAYRLYNTDYKYLSLDACKIAVLENFITSVLKGEINFVTVGNTATIKINLEDIGSKKNIDGNTDQVPKSATGDKGSYDYSKVMETLTVGELIKQLRKHPDHTPVFIGLLQPIQKIEGLVNLQSFGDCILLQIKTKENVQGEQKISHSENFGRQAPSPCTAPNCDCARVHANDTGVDEHQLKRYPCLKKSRSIECPTCIGFGEVEDDGPKVCPSCGGNGVVDIHEDQVKPISEADKIWDKFATNARKEEQKAQGATVDLKMTGQIQDTCHEDSSIRIENMSKQLYNSRFVSLTITEKSNVLMAIIESIDKENKSKLQKDKNELEEFLRPRPDQLWIEFETVLDLIVAASHFGAMNIEEAKAIHPKRFQSKREYVRQYLNKLNIKGTYVKK